VNRQGDPAVTEREAFLQAIREAPDDDATRLIFADWLDERNDPLGAFIRLQYELEPLWYRYDDERVNELLEREKKMIAEHQAALLGPLADLPHELQLQPRFRRGLVEVVSLPVQTFLDHSEELMHWCPALREVTLFQVRGRGADLARSPHLNGPTQITLADWLTAEDAQALATSSHLGGLQTLEVWLGGRHELAVCRAFASSSALTGLRELRLVQLRGGVTAGGFAEELDARADGLAVEADRLRGQPIIHVHRPFQRLFPLRVGKLRHLLFAGRLADARQAIVAIDMRKDLVMVVFDSEGNATNVQRHSLGDVLVRHPGYPFQDYHEKELLKYLRREFGFELALIHVKEFSTDEGLAVHLFPRHNIEILENLDDPQSDIDDEFRITAGSRIHCWLESGYFVIDWGKNYWAGPDGTVHSS
jgi:uncharacterized protein (TIGR02996 family)